MKKKIFGLALVLSLTAALGACTGGESTPGGSPGAGTEPSDTGTTAPTTTETTAPTTTETTAPGAGATPGASPDGATSASPSPTATP